MAKSTANNVHIAFLASKRKQKGYNQEQMANFLGVSRRTYQRMESEQANFGEIMAICNILGMGFRFFDKSDEYV